MSKLSVTVQAVVLSEWVLSHYISSKNLPASLPTLVLLRRKHRWCCPVLSSVFGCHAACCYSVLCCAHLTCDICDNVTVLNFTCNLLFFSVLSGAAELWIHMRRSKCAVILSYYSDPQLGHLMFRGRKVPELRLEGDLQMIFEYAASS